MTPHSRWDDDPQPVDADPVSDVRALGGVSWLSAAVVVTVVGMVAAASHGDRLTVYVLIVALIAELFALVDITPAAARAATTTATRTENTP